jgi:hypothetical protein
MGHSKLNFAKDVTEVLQYREEAGELHAKRWHDSGFTNPKFVTFHRQFILKSFDSGMIDVVKVMEESHLIAIIYNIIYKQDVYFYLQGLQYETDDKLKPGLTAQASLEEHYLEQGIKSYDFMGGHSQYKAQLSEATEDLLIIKIQKSLLRFRVENIIRDIKQKLLWPGRNSR